VECIYAGEQNASHLFTLQQICVDQVTRILVGNAVMVLTRTSEK